MYGDVPPLAVIVTLEMAVPETTVSVPDRLLETVIGTTGAVGIAVDVWVADVVPSVALNTQLPPVDKVIPEKVAVPLTALTVVVDEPLEITHPPEATLIEMGSLYPMFVPVSTLFQAASTTDTEKLGIVAPPPETVSGGSVDRQVVSVLNGYPGNVDDEL